MDLFHRMADMAAASLLGASPERRITNEQLSAQLQQMAESDPELAEHFARMAAAVPALAAQRAMEDRELEDREMEDLELEPTQRMSLVGRPQAA